MRAPTRPSLVLITSTKPRHRFLAYALAAVCDLAGVIAEGKRAGAAPAPESDPLMREHVEGFAAAEQRFFGQAQSFPVAAEHTVALAHGEANSDAAFAWIQERRPTYVVLFGSSIIQDRLLNAFPDRVVNIHLGLSPYYRGTATNFWPLVEGEPECVGATIHLASARVDAGPILRQVRPAMGPDDDCHTIGCRTIEAGARTLAATLADYAAGSVLPVLQQPGGGKLFRNRDFNADAIRRMRERFAQGMIPAYLADRARRDARFPIVA